MFHTTNNLRFCLGINYIHFYRKMFVVLMCDKTQEGDLTAQGESSQGSAEYVRVSKTYTFTVIV